ncbi:MAR-binding filament-like protein 1-1 [Salvia splendens]|uniref:MAR-binding filament-like protein 1-1 n=1 Tax=Salvia splendens TaxID=180675 RepID=UPI001102EE40|nr:MAR-binding filament-like protein 1-1 [Salvia splendens]
MSSAAVNSSSTPYQFRQSSSKCCSQPPFPSCSLRIAPSLRENATTTACLQRNSSYAALAIGLPVLRLLRIRAHAIHALPEESDELTASDLDQNEEVCIQISPQEHPSRHPFSILNVLGVLGSGVLAALFPPKKENAISDATLEEDKRELQQQLKEKLYSVGVLQEKIELLTLDIRNKEDTIRHLSVLLSDKDSKLEQLSSAYQQSYNCLTSLESEKKQMQDVILRHLEELDLQDEMVQELNLELITVVAEKDESVKKLDAVLTEYNNFKSSMEEKEASEAKDLGEREGKIHLLDKQLKSLFDEKKRDKVLIYSLRRERDNFKEVLNIEFKNMKIVEEDLRRTKTTLERSRDETFELLKQSKELERLCSELGDQVYEAQAESREARELLYKKLEEAKQGEELLSKELSSSNDLLIKSDEELRIMSTELTAALQKCNGLEEELVDALRKAEITTSDLNEDKRIISSLKKELMDLETQMLGDKEARESLESYLEEATKSLNDITRHASMLSRELELAHSQVLSLEHENDDLCNIITEQKQAFLESRVHLEDAYNLVMKLGKERESLIKRGKKLEEELAYAKGEIIRLMRQINSSKPAGNVEEEEKVDVGDKAAGDPIKKIHS